MCSTLPAEDSCSNFGGMTWPNYMQNLACKKHLTILYSSIEYAPDDDITTTQ